MPVKSRNCLCAFARLNAFVCIPGTASIDLIRLSKVEGKGRTRNKGGGKNGEYTRGGG